MQARICSVLGGGVLLLMSAWANAAEDTSKQVELLNSQLKVQLQQMQEAQEKQLKDFQAQHQAFLKQKQVKKQAIKKEMRALSDAKAIDQAKLDKLAKQAGQLASDSLKNRVMAKHAVMQILTPEQLDMLKKAKKNMHQQMMKKPV